MKMKTGALLLTSFLGLVANPVFSEGFDDWS